MELEGVKYDAFISYRHAELDSFVAENIHRRLEKFRLPKSVIKKYGITKTRIERVFRDVEELPLTDNLSDPINNALSNTDYLIVIATPRYLQSRWCLQEITTFLETHDREHVLTVLAEGEPYESFPEILTYEDVTRTDVNGNTTVIREEREPLAADSRGNDKKEILKTMDTVVTKLCATMFGLNYDDLKQRRREQRLKRIALLASLVGIFVLGFAIFATSSLLKIRKQNEIITEQYAELENKYASSMAMASDTLLGEGRRLDALYVARSVLPDSSENGYNTDALYALNNALNEYGSPGSYFPVRTFDCTTTIDDYRLSANGSLLAASDLTGYITVFDTSTGEILQTIPDCTVGAGTSFDFCSDKGLIYVTDTGNIVYRDIVTGKEKTLLKDKTDFTVFSAGSGTCTLIYADGKIYSVSPGANLDYTVDLEEYMDTEDAILYSYSFSGDLYAVSIIGNYDVFYFVINLKKGDVTSYFSIDFAVESEVCLDAARLYFDYYDATKGKTHLYCLNIIDGQMLWEQEIEEYFYGKIVINDRLLFLSGAKSVDVCDKFNGTYYNSYYLRDVSALIYTDESGDTYLTTSDGKWYHVDETNLTDLSYTLFTLEPTLNVQSGRYRDNVFYLYFNSTNYITCYREDADLKCEKVGGLDNKPLFNPDDPADDRADDLDGINKNMIKRLFYSDDKEYIVCQQTNYVVTVYDAKTGRKYADSFKPGGDIVRLTRLNDDTLLASSRYSGFLLNNDLEILAKCDPLVENGKKDFTAYSTAAKDNYRYRLYSYEEIIGMADDLLKDYTPPQDVVDRFNIS